MYLFRRFASARVAQVAVAITLLLAAWLLKEMTEYLAWYSGGAEPVFVVEKRPFSQSWLWRMAFGFHIAGAAVCLVSGFPLFFAAVLRRPRVHRFLGYVYLNAVLWAAAPAGLLIAPVSKGGPVAAAGFMVAGAFWWVATWLGYRRIREGDVASHIRWMVRSYSLALSAVWFRVLHIVFGVAGIDPVTNYVVSIWGSTVVSIALAEWCIGWPAPRSWFPATAGFVSQGRI